ncbi:MAG: ATP-binding protein [Pseudomonadota bacterium]
MRNKVNCWELFRCKETQCPVYKLKELTCWLVSETHCRSEIQGKFLEKIEVCVECEAFKANIDLDNMEDTLQAVNRQFTEYRRMVEERDRELESISMELALGLSEVFEALKEISSGDPSVRIHEFSELELIGKLKHMVNLTAENLAEIVDLSHEFAIGLAEHFDVLHRVSRGDLTARVTGASKLELLQSLKKVTNHMIESVFREITEREEAQKALRASEAELRDSEEKYRFLFNYDPNSIFVLDADTLKIIDVNAKALEMYGYEKDELVGKSFLQLGTVEYSGGVLSKRSTVPSRLTSVYSNVQHRRKDGELFYVNVYASQRRKSGKYGVIVTTVDITEMLEKESQLVQASKMTTLGEMATGIAHELNQPLSVIKTASIFLAKKVKKKEPISEEILQTMAEEIDRHVDRASRIINHMREFGRKSEVRKEPVQVNQALTRALEIFSQQLRLREIKVVKELEENLPPIWADSNRLEQVFVNLLLNARDAIENKWKEHPTNSETREIRLKSSYKDRIVTIKVADTGAGIPKSIIDKVFEPFFTTKKVGEGTGLGLSISYGIVRDYHGSIQVESKEGEGSEFIITFPIPSKA